MPKKPMKVIYAVVLLLAGCALQERGYWVRPNTTEAQWKQDNYECTKEATYQPQSVPYPGYYWCGYRHPCPWYYVPTGPQGNTYLYELCLEARGYEWMPEVQQ
jgi:hypothetical protein